jgi:peptide/nickel transport system substrate-binding protein
MKMLKSTLMAAAFALATSSAALAARTDLTLGLVLEPPHLDPTASAAAVIGEVTYANIYEGLTRINDTGTVLPDLAESWTVSEDGTVYTFKLRSGVKFHDGTAFGADDVKFTLDRARAKDSVNPQKPYFAHIKAVDVVDPTTVKVTLDQPQGLFLYDMAMPAALIVAPESAATNKEKPVGTGPFKFDHWAKGSEITLVKNPDYWGTPPPSTRRSSASSPTRPPPFPRSCRATSRPSPTCPRETRFPRSSRIPASRSSSERRRAKRSCRSTTRSRPSTSWPCGRRSPRRSTARRS